jgi:hypothetical protein
VRWQYGFDLAETPEEVELLYLKSGGTIQGQNGNYGNRRDN